MNTVLGKMMRIIPFILIISLSLSSCKTQEKRLLGKWMYVSIRSGQENLPIYEGDGIEFTETKVLWRWLGKNHIHYYVLDKINEKHVFTGYKSSVKDTPDIKGIYKVFGKKAKICDREAALGFPTDFSADEGTLIILKRVKE